MNCVATSSCAGMVSFETTPFIDALCSPTGTFKPLTKRRAVFRLQNFRERRSRVLAAWAVR
jgi:hypothetical protein